MFKRPKGTKDIYGQRQEYKTMVVKTLEGIASFYNYKQIETPIFESISLFNRSIGETSDIVSKEMYEFKDKKGREFVLRPEGTAGTIRAFVENKLYSNTQPTKLFYNGPLFRYERPQKGRQRQFTQFGIELIGIKTPVADVEIIMMAHQILQTLRLKNVKLLINSLGDKETREAYSKALKKYFHKYKKQLTDISITRIDTNPLRILDDKIDGQKDFVLNAPKISEFYSKGSKEYFDNVLKLLDGAMIPYEISDKLVRGLDYYSETIFEFISTSTSIGSQSTLIGGGRYDNLVEQFGGPKMSGTGFGIGLERIINEVEQVHKEIKTSVDVYVVNMDSDMMIATNSLTYMLRTAGFITEYNLKPLKLNKTFDKAKNKRAKFVLIFGKKEIKIGEVIIKDQKTGNQESVKIENIIKYLDQRIEE